ncbi:PadR family transcriptional regulator [Geodermatophilus sp. URMC 64]
MDAEPRMTIPTQLVLEALLRYPEQELYGLEIGERAGLRSGTVHPILARLEGIGWLTSRWEDIDPQAEGRPPRRYYRFTADGLLAARTALARAHYPSAVRQLRPQAGEA